MALKQATQVTNKVPYPSANGAAEVVPIIGDFTVPTGLAANDVVEMCALPPGYVPVDYVLACEDTDSNGTPTITLDVGVLSGTYGDASAATGQARTCGSEGQAASTVAQAGGITRPTKKDFALIAPSTSERGFGVKLAAGAATLTVGSKWRMTLLVRPQSEGV
jgi:hypothetical protein